MSWPWHETGRQRRRADLLLVRCDTLAARVSELERQRDELRGALARERGACERVVDNALFAAGAQPMFDPDHPRFRPRPVAEQQAEAQQAGRAAAPLTMAEWRQRVEKLEQERAERDRRGQLAEELKALAAERRTQQP